MQISTTCLYIYRWEYKPFYPITGAGESFFDVNTGEIRVRIAKLFSRTFVESVAGSVYRMKFDMETGEFLLEYKPAAVAGGATIIRLHRALHYPDGYDVVIDPPQLAMWDKSSSSSAEDHENEVVIKNLVTPPATVSSTDGFGVVVKVKIVRK